MKYPGKAIAFIDEANITIQAERLGLRIDYKKLLNYLNENYNLLRAYLYTGLDLESAGLNNFVVMLRRTGFRVVHFRGDERPDGSVKANLDVHIAVDMVAMADSYDVAILFSGDGDYVPAIDVVSRKGVRVEVVSLEEHAANQLLDHADHFSDLRELIEDNDLVFRNHRIKPDPKPEIDPEIEKSRQLAITLIQDILKGIPIQAYPVETNIIAKRAVQLDEKNIIENSDFPTYLSVVQFLTDQRAIDLVRKNGIEYISTVNYGAIRGLLNGKR